MRILYVAAEVFPFIKTGGLADVAASLPGALSERGLDIRLLVPAYKGLLDKVPSTREILQLGNPLGCGETRVLETHLPGRDVRLWLVDCPEMYARAGGPYLDGEGREWADNSLRFALLSHVAAGLSLEEGRSWRPDIVHANDWHTGLVPMLVRSASKARPATLFTIHNLAYQGVFPLDFADRLAIPPEFLSSVEFYRQLSFIKAGIRWADTITTVSPNYAKEILTPAFGCGLDGLLRERAADLSGILNGVDYGVWDPATDPHLTCNYKVGDFAGKAACKAAVQRELGLELSETTPLTCFMSRVVHQKMPDMVLEALPAIVGRGMQFALIGEGERPYEDAFRALAQRFPGKVAVRIGYREDAAHRLLSGADILLHPSRFEPCGLLPLYAMRYGTIPVTCRNGGAVDSVVDVSRAAVKDGTATGFCFDVPTADGLVGCLDRASDLYRQRLAWRKLLANAMHQDFSWDRSARAYEEVYRRLAARDTGEAETKLFA